MTNSKYDKTQYNMEFEIRFGKYNRVSSNITQNTFFKVYNMAVSKKTYTLISETFYDNKDKDPIRERLTYTDEKDLIKNMLGLFGELITQSQNDHRYRDVQKLKAYWYGSPLSPLQKCRHFQQAARGGRTAPRTVACAAVSALLQLAPPSDNPSHRHLSS